MDKLQNVKWGSNSRIEAVETKVDELAAKMELLFDAVIELGKTVDELKKPKKRRRLNPKPKTVPFDPANKTSQKVMKYSIAFGTLDTKLIASQFKLKQYEVRDIFNSCVQSKGWKLLTLTASNDVYWNYYFQRSKIKDPISTTKNCSTSLSRIKFMPD